MPIPDFDVFVSGGLHEITVVESKIEDRFSVSLWYFVDLLAGREPPDDDRCIAAPRNDDVLFLGGIKLQAQDGLGMSD